MLWAGDGSSYQRSSIWNISLSLNPLFLIFFTDKSLFTFTGTILHGLFNSTLVAIGDIHIQLICSIPLMDSPTLSKSVLYPYNLYALYLYLKLKNLSIGLVVLLHYYSKDPETYQGFFSIIVPFCQW